MPSDQNPIRMTIRLSPDHRVKLETIAHSQGTSMAAVIRAAVETYDPNAADTEDEQMWLDLISSLVKQTAAEAQKIRIKLEKTIADFER